MYENVIFTADDYLEDYYEYDYEYEETQAPGICHDALLSLILFQTVVNNFYKRQHSLLRKPCTSHRRNVCPSVCPSVTRCYCVKTTQARADIFESSLYFISW